MADAVSLTLPEAGFVLGQTIKALNQAIDRGEVSNAARPGGKPGAGRRAVTAAKHSGKTARSFATKAGAATRRLGQAELRYFAIAADLHNDLTPAGRRRVYRAIKQSAPRGGSVKIGPLAVELEPVDDALNARLGRLAELRESVRDGGGGDPLIKGTDISVYEIAALGKGQSLEEILEDYPSLNEAQVRDAIEFAEAYPKAGRPYPRKSFKRALAELADSGLFDIDTSDIAITPQSFE
jgi:uncharacterized protein (DUF433 family)